MWKPASAIRVVVISASIAAAAAFAGHRQPVAHASAQTFKVAFYNIKSGFGQVGFPGYPVTFSNSSNCSTNAWGVGVVQNELVNAIAKDPAVVALGLAEAWTCATPSAVRTVLGWAANTGETNGVALLSRYGFAGPARWLQLDTSTAINPSDTMWVVTAPVCLDVSCSSTVQVFSAHWGGSSATQAATYALYEKEAADTRDFLEQLPDGVPRVLVGDLNVWEGSTTTCDEGPVNAAFRTMRVAGYLDAWRSVYAVADGSTGMWNRQGCGTPNGNLFKRIDQAWSKFLPPVSIKRFGMVTPGYAAPSDHAGIIAEYGVPASLIGTVPPSVSIGNPSDNAVLAGKANVTVAASDNAGISRVELLVDGAAMAVDTTSPYSFTWDTRLVTNGAHVLTAAATDTSGNRTVSLPRTVSVDNPSYPGDDVVMHGVEAQVVGPSWSLVADSTAASKYRLQNSNASVTVTTPLASPASYVEFTFSANAGESYRLWIRGKAINDDPANDSVFAQFDGAVNASGTAMYRIGTTSAATVNLEECGGCGLSGWGWRDDGFPRDVIGTAIYFANTGTQRIRIQAREDGLGIDQVVLSAVNYRWASPGLLKNDTTILPATSGSLPPPNVPPTVAVTMPATGATFSAPATISIAAAASDIDGTVARVDFYAGATLIGTDTTSPYSTTWSNVAAGSYSLTARATDNAGAMTTSAPVTVTVSSGTGTLPSPWVQQDIGAVGVAGSASLTNGIWTVSGSGADVWDTSDQFHYVYQPLTGDGEIVARVATEQNVSDWTKAGVMIRDTTAANARHGFMLVTPSGVKGLAFQRRVATGGLSTNTSGGGGAPPVWVRLRRSGSMITAYRSGDGVSWTLVGSDTIAMGTSVTAGLAVSSHSNTQLATATFDHVSVAVTSPSLPSPWAQQDVGAVGLAGSASLNGNTWTVTGAGTDIWDIADQFHFVYQPLAGDGTITARVATEQNVSDWTKAGVMIRATLAADSAHGFMLVTPSGVKGLAFQRRVVTGGLSTNTSGGSGAPPAWVRVTRSGSTIAAYRSADGVTWTLVGSDAIQVGSTVFAGLAVASHDATQRATATFDNVSVTAAAP